MTKNIVVPGIPVDNHLRWFVETRNRIMRIYLLVANCDQLILSHSHKKSKENFCCVMQKHG